MALQQIQIGNLPPNTRGGDVREWLEQFGQLRGGIVMLSDDCWAADIESRFDVAKLLDGLRLNRSHIVSVFARRETLGSFRQLTRLGGILDR